jgi:hypothetical protein
MDANWVRNLWYEPSTSGLPDCYKAKRYIAECYYFGIINRITYDLAMQKIKQVQNGSWMFEGINPTDSFQFYNCG